MKILITGTNSGLGKFLKKRFCTISFTKKNNHEFLLKKKWDLIVHCAFNTNPNITFKNNFKDNLSLSYKISKHKCRIIFISSIDVYRDQKQKKEFYEDTKLNIFLSKNKYSKSKLMCENFFKKSKLNIILRCGSLIGPDMKKNTIFKILKSNNKEINLSEKSIYSFVHYEEIYFFIKKILFKKDVNGIYNFTRNSYFSLKEICNHLNKKVKFGKYKFEVVNANNSKIKKFIDLDKINSLELLKSMDDNLNFY